MAESDERAALGIALGRLAEQSARAVETRLGDYRWVGRQASRSFIESRPAVTWFATLLLARWLVSGIERDDDETAWISRRGRLAADEQLSIINIARSHLVWRDVITQLLIEEAQSLRTPPDVLTRALDAVCRSCDASLMSMAATFDSQMQVLGQELEAERDALRHQALHDPLTGLPNRMLVFDRLEQAVLTGRREKLRFAVMAIDLDGFKAINDSFGHHWGDVVLREAAGRLRGVARGSDTIGRFGGDEFVAILRQVGGNGASMVARKMLDGLSRPFDVDGGEASLTASVGIAVYPTHGNDANGLLLAADSAMYTAKRTGSNVTVFDASQEPARGHAATSR